MALFKILSLAVAVLGIFVASSPAMESPESQDSQKIAALEKKISSLDWQLRELPSKTQGGGIVFLFGAFCAFWAQNTGRNAWLWFILGMIFSVIAVIVLLRKNSLRIRPLGL